jgi:hypothetical protein
MLGKVKIETNASIFLSPASKMDVGQFSPYELIDIDRRKMVDRCSNKFDSGVY